MHKAKATARLWYGDPESQQGQKGTTGRHTVLHKLPSAIIVPAEITKGPAPLTILTIPWSSLSTAILTVKQPPPPYPGGPCHDNPTAREFSGACSLSARAGTRLHHVWPRESLLGLSEQRSSRKLLHEGPDSATLRERTCHLQTVRHF